MNKRPRQIRTPLRSEEELRFGYLIHDVSRLRRTIFDRWLAPSGITRSQWWVLAFLARQDGMPQTDLADQLDVGKVALGALIDRLEAAGFAERRPAPSDRRVKLVCLTQKGRELLRTLRRNSREFNQRILAGIAAEDVVAAIGTLGQIKRNLLMPSDDESLPYESWPASDGG
ncbi:MarR family winged helix-turn-helix transcriptional regulator [Mesorhizobium australicum]|uniref:DNA-binding transcriptional regulator, MarR family n=1 Tax=Mesorhizobium australicum TaxID=536018 RepID=A0A1X7PTM8_9HYPH|nr:MarR family transcriptional regulator [Mesorhizobium australicum]SMH54585.1 DNA-binding transcriptional regulator, MarR family [Mesorhizobium australicum]